MREEDKSKGQLIEEIQELRRRLGDGVADEAAGRETGTVRSRCAQSAFHDDPRESSQLFRRLFDGIADISLMIDISGKIIEVNQRACACLGYDRQGLLGLSAMEIGVGIDFTRVEDTWKSLGGGNVITLEGTYRCLDGTVFPVEENIRAFEYRRQDLFLVCARDISKRRRAEAGLEEKVVERTAQLRQEILERKLAEESLRNSEQKYRELVENANSIILKMDGRGRVIFFNEFAQKFFGYKERELLGRSVVGTIVPEVDAGGRNPGSMIRDLASHPEKYARNENENMRRNGERVWIAWTNKPLFDSWGRPVGVLCIGNDITELKRTEEQLQIFRRFADNAGQGLAMADLDGQITYMNTALVEMIGEVEWNPGQGRNLIDFVPKEHRQKLRTEIHPLLFERGDWTGELPLLSGKGHEIPALVNLFLIRDDAGNPRHIAELTTDLTHQKETEREIMRAKESAESADRIKSAFLASMSHELRTPLNSIIGFTGILLQGLAGELNAEQRKQMGMIQSSARHLLQLINDVLDISKIEAGQLNLSIASFDLLESFEGIIQTIRLAAEKKGLKLLLDFDPDARYVVSDRRRVEQVLINLVNNAIKFTDHGEVRVKSTVEGGHVVTSVTDTGIGISPRNMGTLFVAFRQIDGGLARRYEGTGLGLSICKGLVAMLGGSIWAESAGEGMGSTFTFTLPVAGGQ